MLGYRQKHDVLVLPSCLSMLATDWRYYQRTGKKFIPRAQVNLPKDAIAGLTHNIRILTNFWGTARRSKQDHNPEELACKISDYLNIETQVGPRLQRWAGYHAGRNPLMQHPD